MPQGDRKWQRETGWGIGEKGTVAVGQRIHKVLWTDVYLKCRRARVFILWKCWINYPSLSHTDSNFFLPFLDHCYTGAEIPGRKKPGRSCHAVTANFAIFGSDTIAHGPPPRTPSGAAADARRLRTSFPHPCAGPAGGTWTVLELDGSGGYRQEGCHQETLPAPLICPWIKLSHTMIQKLSSIS